MIGGADGDLIVVGLLLELKTSAKLTLAVKDLFQVIGYALLDFDDDYKLADGAVFSARYAYLAVWSLGGLLGELAGHPVSLQAARQEFGSYWIRIRARCDHGLDSRRITSPRPDLVIPLINIRQADYWQPNGHHPLGWIWVLGARTATAVGWFLATLLVAGCSGLARKE